MGAVAQTTTWYADGGGSGSSQFANRHTCRTSNGDSCPAHTTAPGCGPSCAAGANGLGGRSATIKNNDVVVTGTTNRTWVVITFLSAGVVSPKSVDATNPGPQEALANLWITQSS